MTGHRDHPLNAPLNAMVTAMNGADQQMSRMSENIGDFDSKELTPQEDELVFHNPHLRFIGQVHPQTGMPYTNAQASSQLLAEIGPEEYVKYVEDFVRRSDRRQKDTADAQSVD